MVHRECPLGINGGGAWNQGRVSNGMMRLTQETRVGYKRREGGGSSKIASSSFLSFVQCSYSFRDFDILKHYWKRTFIAFVPNGFFIHLPAFNSHIFVILPVAYFCACSFVIHNELCISLKFIIVFRTKMRLGTVVLLAAVTASAVAVSFNFLLYPVLSPRTAQKAFHFSFRVLKKGGDMELIPFFAK